MKLKFIKFPKKSQKPLDRKRLLRNGSYSAVLAAFVVAGAVVLNLIAAEIPSQYTSLDVSDDKLYTLTEQTKELAASLTEDVTLYYIVQDSNRDDTVSRLLERYDDLSSHITVEERDPVLYPNFVSQYTSDSLTENSVIVVCGDQSRIVNYEDMYEQEFNYTYYTYETTGFDAEGQITSAISGVSSGDLPTLYVLTGHNELQLDDTMTRSIEKENIAIESLNLITEDAVPEDAGCLLIYSPAQDLSDAETTKILNYLRTGGKAVILTDYTAQEMPNLASVLEYYGVTLEEGIVLEGDSQHYVQLPYYLIPDINSTDFTSDLTGGSTYVLMAAAQSIQTAEEPRDGVSISSILTTSDASYSKADPQNMSTYEKEEGDTEGPFDIGVAITETVELTDELLDEVSGNVEEATLSDDLPVLEEEESSGDSEETSEASEEEESEETADASGEEDTSEDSAESEGETENAVDPETAETRIVLFSSSTILDSSADQMVSGGNSTLFLNALSWLCGNETSVSIPVKSISTSYLTITAASSSFWSIFVIGILPGGFLVTGLAVWLHRRKK
ncbi:MAG TPA: GldG family protein [Candidatus Choladousia intestinavium]|uniref:GldG family protein n=1 Tax=Candidatus Choladousia intestinavium TaxID=2840727 RepID=A0A9D1D8Y8_9FIRM|nr:GldG family protein [Candidatus Choladousia intestinavium]